MRVHPIPLVIHVHRSVSLLSDIHAKLVVVLLLLMYSRTTISKGSGVTRRITARFGSTITSVAAADVYDGDSSIAVLKSSSSLAMSIQYFEVAIRNAPFEWNTANMSVEGARPLRRDHQQPSIAQRTRVSHFASIA